MAEDSRQAHGGLSRNALVVAMLLSALATEAIGIHAIFGAVFLGALIPHDSLIAREVHHRLEDLVVVLLLPAFFAYTGLRLHDPAQDSLLFRHREVFISPVERMKNHLPADFLELP